MRQAELARYKGLFEDALRNYSRAVEADRSNIAGWVGQARMLIALEEYPEAEMWSRKALELFREQSELTAARAQALCRAGDVKQALALCDAAIAKPGQSVYPWIVRGDVMLSRRDSAESHCFNMAVQLKPEWTTLVDIIETYLHHRQHAKALVRCQEAVAKAPEQAYCWYLQGACQMLSGMNDAGHRSLKHCLELDQHHAAALKALQSGAGESWLRRLFH